MTANRFLDCEFYLPEVEYFRPPWSFLFLSCAPAGLRKLSGWAEAILAATYLQFLRWRLRAHRVNVVHSHFANTGWLYRNIARRLDALHVVSFYGWDYEHLATIYPEWKPRILQLFVGADLLLCEGPHGAEILAQLGCPKDKIRVCKLGVDTKAIPFIHRTKTPGELRLLQIASFREKKGHIDSVKALAEAMSACPSATLTLVGDGDISVLSQVRLAIAEAGLQHRVQIIPGIDISRLHDFMRDYHVFIHPSVHTSLKDCEGGAPIVLLDAQATGMPVISTLHCDIPEEVVDGSSGLLCAEHDIDEIAAAITRFYYMGQAEYDAFSSRARIHVVTRYDSRDCSISLRDIYVEAIALARKRLT